MNIQYPFAKILFVFAIELFLIIFLARCSEDENTPILLPTITRISPESGYPGTIVSISGKNFALKTSDNVVKINNIKAIVKEMQGDSIIRVIIPESATSGGIQVESGKQISNSFLFTIPRNPNPPVITSITPATVEIGELITITGSNFRTGLEMDRNIVRISGTRVKVTSATSSELTVYVPGVPQMASTPVSVSVFGTQSNVLPLQVKNFSGTMAWASASYLINDYPLYHSYWVTANADGSTSFSDREIFRSDQYWDLLESASPQRNGLKKGDPVYSPKSQTLYFLKDTFYDIENGVQKSYQVIYQSTTQFDNVKPIYKLDTTPDGSATTDLVVDGIAPDPVGDGLYVFTSSRSTGQKFLEKAFKDGNEPFERIREIFGPSVSNTSITCSDDAVYVTAGSDLWKIPFEPSESESLLTTGLAIALSAIEFNSVEKQIYLLGTYNYDQVEVYRIEEDGTMPEKLASYPYISTSDYAPPIFPRHLRILPGENGASTKVFWVNRGSTGADEILCINLKGVAPYTPVVLYDKPEEIGFDPSTIPSPPGYSIASVGFFQVFN